MFSPRLFDSDSTTDFTNLFEEYINQSQPILHPSLNELIGTIPNESIHSTPISMPSLSPIIQANQPNQQPLIPIMDEISLESIEEAPIRIKTESISSESSPVKRATKNKRKSAPVHSESDSDADADADGDNNTTNNSDCSDSISPPRSTTGTTHSTTRYYPSDRCSNLSSSDKRARRMKQNREAAATSRQRKKAYLQDLEQSVNTLKQQQNQLEAKLKLLMKENKQLKAMKSLSNNNNNTNTAALNEAPITNNNNNTNSGLIFEHVSSIKPPITEPVVLSAPIEHVSNGTVIPTQTQSQPSFQYSPDELLSALHESAVFVSPQWKCSNNSTVITIINNNNNNPIIVLLMNLYYSLIMNSIIAYQQPIMNYYLLIHLIHSIIQFKNFNPYQQIYSNQQLVYIKSLINKQNLNLNQLYSISNTNPQSNLIDCR